MSPRRHKRRRLDTEPEPVSVQHEDSTSPVLEQDGAVKNVAELEVAQEAPTQEIQVDGLAKQCEIWDAFKEEHYEVLEQLPLSLHRIFHLIQELDQQAQERINNISPAILKYISLRRTLANAAKQTSGGIANAAHEGSDASPAVEVDPPSSGANVENSIVNRNATYGLRSSPAPVRTQVPYLSKSKSHTPSAMRSLAAVVQSSDSTRELLITIAQSAEDISRAANEKYYLARHVYDLVDRYIRDLDRAIKEQETSISLGLRPGTHPASIILPELIIPKSSRNRLVASPLPPETTEDVLLALAEPSMQPSLADAKVEAAPPSAEEEAEPISATGAESTENVIEVEGPVRPSSRGWRRGRRRRRPARAALPPPEPEPASVEGVEERPIDIEAEDDAPDETQAPLTLKIPAQAASEAERRYCFCNQVSYGCMIACDNPKCAIEWFHMGCVGLTKGPRGLWYCRDCAFNNKRPKGKKAR